MAIKPVLKWVGGKRQLISEIKKKLPANYNNYHEPFLGGGAVLFSLKPNVAFVNDHNEELLNVYKIIKKEPMELINDLKKHSNEANYFYNLRKIDRDENLYNCLTPIEKASRIIFLNKTAYNGLYRVNSRGELNAPFGRYKNPLICDVETINDLSNFFKNNSIKFTTGDFEKTLVNIKKKDFVYIDPPYDPVSTTSSFTGYQAGGFSKDEQIRVKNYCDKITEKGAYFMLSNSYTDFILNLYKEYVLHEVLANRSINSKGKKRKKIKEIIITNY